MTRKSMDQATKKDGRILVCGGTDGSVADARRQLTASGWTVDAVCGIDSALTSLETGFFDVCLVTSELGASASALAARIAALDLTTQLFVLGPDVSLELSEEHAARGTHGMTTLLKTREVPAALADASERSSLRKENRRLKRQLHSRLSQDLIGHSDAVDHLREIVRQVADHDTPLMLEGESGTEMGAIARAAHTYSRRAHRSFLAFDCSVLSSDCLLRALFGDPPESIGECSDPPHRQDGCLGQGDCGTVLLENIDHVALPLQKTLAEAFEELCSRAADHPARATAPRLIATTHANLSELCNQNRFRADLLNLFGRTSITVPPLRHRQEDISPLTEHFMKKHALSDGRPPKRLTLDGLELLKAYDWPGNVQELQNVIERACTLDDGQRLTGDMLRPWLSRSAGDQADEYSGMSLKEMERRLIETTFARCGGNRERTARSLKIGLRTLSGKLRDYGYPPRGGPGSNVAVEQRKAA